MTIHIPSFEEVSSFLVGTILVKYILVGWFAKWTVRLFKWVTISSEEQAISWIHYSEGAMDHGHQYPMPVMCPDGLCIRIKKKP